MFSFRSSSEAISMRHRWIRGFNNTTNIPPWFFYNASNVVGTFGFTNYHRSFISHHIKDKLVIVNKSILACLCFNTSSCITLYNYVSRKPQQNSCQVWCTVHTVETYATKLLIRFSVFGNGSYKVVKINRWWDLFTFK